MVLSVPPSSKVERIKISSSNTTVPPQQLLPIKAYNRILEAYTYASKSQGRIHGLKSGGRIMASARNEAPKTPRGLGVRRGVPSSPGEVSAPSQKFVRFLSSKWQVLVQFCNLILLQWNCLTRINR